MPKISVIVPIYNVEQYLPHCIESILGQSFTDFELILVDDGSPDSSGAICDEYAVKDSRIRVIHKENGGVSTARNAGLEAATGEYVTFCDGDDYYLNDWLERLFDSAVGTDADMVVANYRTVDEKCNMISASGRTEREWSLSNKDLLNGYLINGVLFNGGVWSACVCLFRHSIIKDNNILFCSKCNHYEDRGFIAEYTLYCTHISWISYDGYCYIMHDDSASHSIGENCFFNMVNESSWQFGERYFRIYQGKEAEHIFSVIHFAFMYPEYSRLIYSFERKRYDSLPKELEHIENKAWNNKWCRELFFSQKMMDEYFVKAEGSKDLPMIARYSIHRQPWLFMLESAITYKFFSKQ